MLAAHQKIPEGLTFIIWTSLSLRHKQGGNSASQHNLLAFSSHLSPFFLSHFLSVFLSSKFLDHRGAKDKLASMWAVAGEILETRGVDDFEGQASLGPHRSCIHCVTKASTCKSAYCISVIGIHPTRTLQTVANGKEVQEKNPNRSPSKKRKAPC